VDWQISALLSGEYYCDKIAALTRDGVDTLMGMADRVKVDDEETAGKIFESLLKTGLGMSFAQNSRPASGAEHVIAHLIECFELMEDKEPNFHGEDVGVCTLAMLKYYNELASHESIKAKREELDWDDIYKTFGEMADDVRRMNTPDTITDAVDPKVIEENWGKIRDIIHSVPSYEECLATMRRAGCKITLEDIGKSSELFDKCVKYSPYMRRRLTLLRMRDMIEV
jgi:glycerol-1-phosphate dehydrogenase [NAD(P)+]